MVAIMQQRLGMDGTAHTLVDCTGRCVAEVNSRRSFPRCHRCVTGVSPTKFLRCSAGVANCAETCLYPMEDHKGSQSHANVELHMEAGGRPSPKRSHSFSIKNNVRITIKVSRN